MTESSSSNGPEARVYALVARGRSQLGAAARRATQTLSRSDRNARELADLVRWEGEGGALRPRSALANALPRRLSMRFAMSALPAHDVPPCASVEATTANPAGKPASLFAGERNFGPPQSKRPRQSAPKRPMNTHRGSRSR
jgi:hypothetical protein